jgi:hypothetical protein
LKLKTGTQAGFAIRSPITLVTDNASKRPDQVKGSSLPGNCWLIHAATTNAKIKYRLPEEHLRNLIFALNIAEMLMGVN